MVTKLLERCVVAAKRSASTQMIVSWYTYICHEALQALCRSVILHLVSLVVNRTACASGLVTYWPPCAGCCCADGVGAVSRRDNELHIKL
jgi:hypothetical protein